jgi:TolA-binding protein
VLRCPSHSAKILWDAGHLQAGGMVAVTAVDSSRGRLEATDASMLLLNPDAAAAAAAAGPPASGVVHRVTEKYRQQWKGLEQQLRLRREAANALLVEQQQLEQQQLEQQQQGQQQQQQQQGVSDVAATEVVPDSQECDSGATVKCPSPP